MAVGLRVASAVGAAFALSSMLSGRTDELVAAVALLFIGTGPHRLSVRSAVFSIEVIAGELRLRGRSARERIGSIR
jgi:hypothetical protein